MRIGDLVKWTDFYGKDHYGIVTLNPSIRSIPGNRLISVLNGGVITHVREKSVEVISDGVNIP